MQCSLCNNTLVDPKLVDCFHVFCKLCIKKNCTEADQKYYIFKCPRCDSQTLLQELNDVEDLQISPVHTRILKGLEFLENQKICSVSSSHPEALWQCLDCDRSLCEECLRYHSEFIKNHQVVSLSTLEMEDIDKMLKREPFCKAHDSQNMKFFCEECDMLICQQCMEEHHNHKTLAMQDIIAIERNSHSKNLEQIEKMATDEKEKKLQKEIASTMKRDGEKAKQEVKELTKKLVKTLKHNEQKLLNEIEESITKAERNSRIINHTTQAQEYIKYFMENGTVSEMIDTRQEKSSRNFTYDPFEKNISGIEFKPNGKLFEQAQLGVGLVRLFYKKADPKMSSIKVVPADIINATKRAKLVMELKTSEGEVAQEPLENVDITFTPEDDVKVGELELTDDSGITVDFIPCVSGQLTADIKLNGNPVYNSPLVMLVKPQQIKEMSEHSKLKDALNTGSNKSFTGIAVNTTNSMIAVADCTSHCIRVYNMEGDLLLTHGSQGSGQRELNYPHGLAFLNEKDLVIADYHNHRICIVDTSTGQLVKAFGCYGSNKGQFQYPGCVHVDNDSNIMVCDQGNCCVQVFTKDGDYLYHFGVSSQPYDIVTHNKRFYISDLNNSRVHVIEIKDNLSPTRVATITGGDYGQLQRPYGLAIDNDHNLLICDNGASMIHKFTLDGRYVGQSSQINNPPYYIAVLKNGQMICTSHGGGVVFLDNGPAYQ